MIAAVKAAVAISIHAPTRGATFCSRLHYHLRAISIHAPTRGATIVLNDALTFEQFQSTLPRGERLRKEGKYAYTNNFNPRSHEGSDGLPSPCKFSSYNFNPRSHEGSDCLTINGLCNSTYFNPRSHEGSDGIICS